MHSTTDCPFPLFEKVNGAAAASEGSRGARGLDHRQEPGPHPLRPQSPAAPHGAPEDHELQPVPGFVW